ncbi:ROK family protein, partial [Salmonella enterica]|uniref:ROK family protein n=1 Tax=Salmonella enterica TaxID=28901 RepID=UPI003299C9D8
HFPIGQTREAIAGLPTLAVNAAQAAACAEDHALPDDIRDMVIITVSTGVGGGVVCDGNLLTGNGGQPGHQAHTQADPHDPVCACG